MPRASVKRPIMPRRPAPPSYTFGMVQARGRRRVLAGVSPVLVGRVDLLALAARRWQATGDGVGHLLLLAGEAGIGKTRLIAEIVDAAGDGVRTITASAFPRDTDAAGGVLLDLADELRRRGLHEPAERLRRRLLDESDRAGDAARRRRVLLGDLAGMIEELFIEMPTMLVIEDLHWADDLSLDVLERLAGALRTTRGMVIASYRSDELFSGTSLGRWRGRILAHRFGEEVRLPRLDSDETAALMAAISGVVPASDLVHVVHERSDGIPFHVEELVAGGASSVPETVAEAVRSRTDALQPATRAIVAAGSVIGRSFDIDLLEAITEESTATVDEALRELVDRLLVVRKDEGSHFGFRHSLVCDAIYDVIPPHRRRALHAAVARAAAEAGFRDAYVSEHYERGNEPALAHRFALAAAAGAVRVSAHREAAELYRRALRTMSSDIPPATRARLHANLAGELAAIDDNESAVAQLAAAIGLYRDLGDEDSAAGMVPKLMAARHLLGASLEARTALARDALDRLDARPGGGSPAVRGELLAALSAAYMLDRRLDEALDFGTRASALIGGAGAWAERADIDITLGSVLVFAGQGDEGWRMLEDSIAACEQGSHEAQTARGLRMIGTSASVLVEYDRATRWIAEGLDYTTRTERWNDHHYLASHLAHVQWAVGDWAAAERTASQALADGRGITTRITALIVLGYLAVGRNELDAAQARLGEALELGEAMQEIQRLSPPLWGLAELALRAGDPRRAAELCERGYSESARVSDAAYFFPYVVTGVRALLALREPSAAREWLRRCAVLVGERGIPGTLPVLDHAEGLIELAEGRTGKARLMLERASDEWMTRRRFWEGTESIIDLAHCAVRSRRPAEAARLVAQARDLARRAGATLLESLADAVVVTGDDEAGPLTAREFEVARLVASGATNREIAAALTVSPKTVSAHIEHILTKLGAGRRAEIAAWVTRVAPD